jgi:hypothetical protein
MGFHAETAHLKRADNLVPIPLFCQLQQKLQLALQAVS